MAGYEPEKASTSSADVPAQDFTEKHDGTSQFRPLDGIGKRNESNDDGVSHGVHQQSESNMNDEISSAPSNAPSSTGSSRPESMQNPRGQLANRKYFHSRRIKKGEVEKPWLKKKDRKEIWVTIIPLLGILAGLAASGILIWDGLRSVVNHSYCVVLDEDFDNGLRPDIWEREVELGGFGNGQFEITTGTDENAYTEDSYLIIKPTLMDADLINQNETVDLRKPNPYGLCTSKLWSNCYGGTNTTNGTIFNPVKSARINTKPDSKKRGASIRYGRVEITAKLPSGDWLWPALWMLPVSSKYGEWPKSGEIDIMESRGNNYTYPQGGDNIMSSTLHMGPESTLDVWWKTNVKRKALHTTYADGYHTYGMEWSEKYIFTYVDSRLLQVMYVNFDEPMWQYGNFPVSDVNGSIIDDPWSQTGRDSTPFDQDFYLILNVAVGGTNGWFEDGVDGKPWADISETAKLDFWKGKDQWYPTWHDGGELSIKSVKMWQQSGYNGCTA